MREALEDEIEKGRRFASIERKPKEIPVRRITVAMAVSLLLTQSLAAQPADRTDRAALTALFRATGGSGWMNSRNWLSDRPLGEWHGVETDAAGRVIRLVLFSNGLSGRLPPALGDLTELRALTLYDNNLAGPIPHELGKLTRLATLELHNNDLTGPIPTEIGNLSSLGQLLLDNNRLKGEIPTELGNLRALTLLGLSGNGLTGEVPSSLGGLVRLTYLYLGRNALLGPLPLSLANLRNLTALQYARTALCVPGDRALAQWLSTIGQHVGTSPCSDRDLLVLLYHATRGWQWTRAQNWLSDRPIGEWQGVETDAAGRVSVLAMAGNNLSGEIPRGIGALTSLERLHLENNDLAGEIPGELGNLGNLEYLSLGRNRLSGEVSAELARLGNLRGLWIRGNRLSGPIPRAFLELERLGTFHFFDNAELCVPDTAEFSEWVARRDARGPLCGQG